MGIATINPTTGETVQTFDPMTESQINKKIGKAEETFRSYRRSSFADRGKWMIQAARILEEEQDRFGRLMTLEMGKPIKAAKAEALKCAWACRYYVENGERFLADIEIKTDATRSGVHFQPLGPILAVMPWNFPFWQVFRFAVPSLMAGNVALLKHASNVPQCALAIEDVFTRAGFPEGAFQTLLIGSDKVSRVIDDPRIRAATLTGSVGAGRAIGGEAGRRIKKTVLELGGSDPFIVMPSADLNVAVKTAVQARTINNGQSCIAAKRFIVAESIAEPFERQFVEAMKNLKIGDPMDEQTDIGPLATADQVKILDEQVRKSVSGGARLLTGGKPVDRPGFYYPPTVLTDIPKETPAYREEMFGPVASLFRVANIDEAIDLANDTIFGLGSSVWTNDRAERARFIDEMEAGMVFVNAMVASDPRLPFGGVKQSGYGRELSDFGIREFVNIKTVWIKEGGEGRRSEIE
ncbi:MAG: NAD-dependent succinate-semialdehyde dehydrogenase [Candidatus Manganitrophus sp.]|nr:NAD-dependent succinate-semialdehyde dehydrogenase [Candidatus Manganitrophus sp.]WDT72209.1 MAG: NAD-dependent succinate-semialdehyde dehydrogenase [Candidatus Manganitrophus sp.]